MVIILTLLAGGCGGGKIVPPTNCPPIDPTAVPSVGIEGRVSVTIGGSRLEAVPVNDRAPLIVRIASTEPGAEGASRYDLRFLGSVPGTYDLREYLLDPDGAHPTAPTIPVRVRSMVSEDSHDLVEVPASAPPPLGGHRRWLVLAGIAWALVLPLVLWRRRAAPPALIPESPQPSLAEQLAVIVANARLGELPPREQARLERMLIGHWRERLGIASLPPIEALAALRANPEAGALLRQVERWLHGRPGSGPAVDVDALLAPYRSAAPAAGAAP